MSTAVGRSASVKRVFDASKGNEPQQWGCPVRSRYFGWFTRQAGRLAAALFVVVLLGRSNDEFFFVGVEPSKGQTRKVQQIVIHGLLNVV